MPAPFSRILLGILLSLAAGLGAVARGQDTALVEFDSGKVAVVAVEWGWDGTLAPERFNPARFTVRSDEAFSGALIVEYPQDASQNARIIAPFSTTPGTVTTVEVPVCLPNQCEWLKVTLTDGSRNRTRKFRNIGAGDEMPMPGVAGAVRVGVVGDLSAAAVADLGLNPTPGQPNFPVFNQQRPQDRTAQDRIDGIWLRSRVVAIPTAKLARSWIAYECLDVVVAGEDDLLSADPRARDALFAWVRSGGRLVLRLSGGGNRWRELLDDPLAGSIIVEEARPLPVPQDAAAVLATVDARPALSAQAEDEPENKSTINPAPSAPARAIALDQLAQGSGWRTAWQTEPDKGLVASGPVGMGVVCLVGVDPQRMSEVVSVEASRALWRDILNPPVLPARLLREQDLGNFGWGYWNGSGPDTNAAAAIRGVLDSIIHVPPIGVGFFVIIIACMVGLALLAGPPGRWWLKRRGWLSVSWALALACIAVASVMALLSPRLMRTGTTHLGQAHVIDAVCDAEGRALNACTTSLTGVFAGRPGRVRVLAVDGAWWRGVSTAVSYSKSGTNVAPFETISHAAPLGVLASGEVQSLSLGQWTFRAALRQAPMAPAPGIHVKLDVEGETLEVLALPEGWTVDHACALVRGRVWRFRQEENPGGRWFGILAEDVVLSEDAYTEEKDSPWAKAVVEAEVPERMVLMRNLPFARDRSDALLRMAQGGGTAIVALCVRGLTPDVDTASFGTAAPESFAWVRLALPISPAPPPPTATPSKASTP